MQAAPSRQDPAAASPMVSGVTMQSQRCARNSTSPSVRLLTRYVTAPGIVRASGSETQPAMMQSRISVCGAWGRASYPGECEVNPQVDLAVVNLVVAQPVDAAFERLDS